MHPEYCSHLGLRNNSCRISWALFACFGPMIIMLQYPRPRKNGAMHRTVSEANTNSSSVTRVFVLSC